jgi:hypothetical protein
VNFVLDAIVTARRTRDAIRQIRAIPTSDRDKKYIMGSWFQEHTRAAPTNAEKEAAYNELLGRERARRIMG